MAGSTLDYSSSGGAMGRRVQTIDRLVGWINALQSPFLLLLRLYIGYESAISGWGHLTHIDETTQFFQNDLHIPMARLNVYISATTELVGGTLLLAGLLSRLAAVPMTFNFLVAIVTSNWAYPKFRDMLLHPFTDDNFTQAVLHDTAFPFLFVSLLVLLFGPGKLSLDYLLCRLFHRKGTETT